MLALQGLNTIKAFALAIACGVIPLSTHAAGLIIVISGQTGSNEISYTASGSVTVTQTHSAILSGSGLGPITAGSWNANFDNNLGDMLRDGMVTDLNDDLALSNGGVSYRRNGVEFGVLDTLDLDGINGGGGDDVELDPTSNIIYPSLTAGDVVSWTGSGTFTLEGGETFDSLFTVGSFSNAIDGGDYTVTITAVPEPSTYALLTVFALCLFAGFRRRQTATSTC